MSWFFAYLFLVVFIYALMLKTIFVIDETTKRSQREENRFFSIIISLFFPVTIPTIVFYKISEKILTKFFNKP